MQCQVTRVIEKMETRQNEAWYRVTEKMETWQNEAWYRVTEKWKHGRMRHGIE